MESETIFFNPDKHPSNTWKAFRTFASRFELRYAAQFTEPPKSAMDSAIQRWELEHPPVEAGDRKPTPNVHQFDTMKEQWKSKDKVSKVLGMFSSERVYEDWMIAEPDEPARSNATWIEFKTKMENLYKPTENSTLNNYQFRSVTQNLDETFPSFCVRVEKEAKSCSFKCQHLDCSAEATAIRDQIIIGTTDSRIREKALLDSWNLASLRTEGTKMESASRGEAEISGGAVNKISNYSFSSLKNRKSAKPGGLTYTCYNCGEVFRGPAFKHNEICIARNQKCRTCGKRGHLPKYCRINKDLKYSEVENGDDGSDDAEDVKAIEDIKGDIYNINIFKISASDRDEFVSQKRNLQENPEFKVEVVINGSLATVTADTGARVCVCGEVEARKWNLLDRIIPTPVKIKPYNSPAVPTIGKARCAVTIGTTSIPVEWYILKGKCEPILSGSASVNLGIIHFTKQPPIYMPIKMINVKLEKNSQEQIQNLLAKRREVFSHTLGKHRSYRVKLHTDPNIKPVIEPPRPTPYHLRERVDKALEEMLKNDVIEEHPVGDPTPWISNAVYVPKPNGSLRVTLDARNINRAIQSSNLPIPRQEDIKAKLGGSSIFSKMDFSSSFWQLELYPESRGMTVFNLNDKLYRYKRLIMGVKSAQGELNAALRPIFRNIPGVHFIHDDVIVASNNITDHIKSLDDCLAAIQKEGLTLNEGKCHFGMDQVTFWGMIINKEGVHPDPEKVDCLEGLERPRNKDELHSFICMMQSVSEFIPSFSRKAAPLRQLLKMKARFNWEQHHQECFNYLLSEFRKDVLLRYFDISKPTYLFTDAHKTGLGAILAQGDSIETALPVAVASRTTTDAEKNYPQIDLEGLGVDYALFRFRHYIVGSPNTITVVTDHQPLCAVFNGNRSGSIRTERYKQRNQDIKFKVMYQKGKDNQTDFLSRRAAPMRKNSEEQQRAEGINNLLYTLHTTPIIDRITLKAIAEETSNDSVLMKLQKIVKASKTYIPKHEVEDLLKFKPILPEITITGNGILLKGERIILPDTLQSLAIQLSHQGSHPRQCSIERRLRYHFFFHNMNTKVSSYLAKCVECSIFTDKKCKEPIKAHKVPDRCWEKVSVDLFGPMPSRKHVVVIQDLASRFPAAKIVSSTAADKVIPAMTELYDEIGNPEVQLSDNGPPFNSASMNKFAQERDIKLEKIPPLHPSANPVETFMRPLGKTMKIANYNGSSDKEALHHLLQNYRDTPHPSTGVPPAAMMFRSTMSGTFPQRVITDDDIEASRRYDKQQKYEKEEQVNSSKYKKQSDISVGDKVLVRNYRRRSKFQPLFNPEQYIVIGISDYGRKLEIERLADGQTLIRHPDDLKRFYLPPKPAPEKVITTSPWELLKQHYDDQDFDSSEWYSQPTPVPAPSQPEEQPPEVPVQQQDQGRPVRARNKPDRLGIETYDEAQPLPGEDYIIPPWWPGYPRD